MPILFSCTNCDKQLRVADDKAGRKVKCPVCSEILVVPDAAEEPPAVVAKRAAVTAKRPKAAAPEQDFEVVEDDPPAGKHDFEVVEDDPPARKRSRKPVDEDEDDRPARDEDAETPARRPKRKKKPKKSGSGKGILLVVLLLGVGLLVLGGGGFAVYHFAFAAGSLEGMKYLPDNCQSIFSERVDQARSSKLYQQVKKEAPNADRLDEIRGESLGLAFADISRITDAGSLTEQVTIVTTTKSVTPADLTAKRKGTYTEKKVGKYSLYVGQSDAFCVPESKIVLSGRAETLEKILNRDKKPILSEGLQKSMKLVNFSKTQVRVIDVQGKTSSVGMGMASFMSLGSATKYTDAEAMGSQIDIGSDMLTTQIILFKNATAAEDAKKKIEEEVNKARQESGKPNLFGDDAAEILNSVKIALSGSKVTVTYTLKAETLIKMVKQMPGR